MPRKIDKYTFAYGSPFDKELNQYTRDAYENFPEILIVDFDETDVMIDLGYSDLAKKVRSHLTKHGLHMFVHTTYL